MILQREIAAIAQARNVAKLTVDKDWVLGHFLDAIYSIDSLRDNLIFKGGTCLKKCYLPDYRFSEDLDFTCRDSNFELTRSHINHICKLVDQRAGILSHVEKFLPLEFENKPTGYQVIIKYWGADHKQSEAPPEPARWLTSVKIEIITYEKLMLSIEEKQVIHNYSDTLTEASRTIPCYSIAEMVSEKLRALIQRSYSAPRDYYDIWMLSQTFTNLDYDTIVNTFLEKMNFKGLQFVGIEQFLNTHTDKIVGTAWSNSLAHQIPNGKLPGYEKVKEDLVVLFGKMFPPRPYTPEGARMPLMAD